MIRTLLIIFGMALGLSLFSPSAQAFRFKKCECLSDYKPPKGVFRIGTCFVKKEWEYRQHCLPCGRRIPYKVKVITYRTRYSNGVARTWKCVVAGTEVTLDAEPLK